MARLPLSASKSLGLPAWLPVLASLFTICLVTFLVLAQMTPVRALPASAPPTAFSAERAYGHLKTIARAPHPTGSPEIARVREYLFNKLSVLGLDPEIQTSTSVYNDTGKWGVAGPRGLETTPDTWSIAGATIHNVVARIPGTASTGAIVLSAHYDSVPFGPGASDDGAGVAAILETARALQAAPPMRNDVILLLTDGEEIGLMGSQAFVKKNPWMADVALVLNLEARGSSGTVLMYETSPNNSWLISEYARAAKDPLTGSVATDVWRLMPNSSDLTMFLQAGKQGMNFAYSENWTDYHTTHDSLEDLDLRSLQHHGDNLLALAQHFGTLDLGTRAEEDAIFFSVLRLAVIHYPKGWALPLMLIVSAAFIILLVLGARRGRLTAHGLAMGVLVVFVSMGAAALAAYLAVQGLDLLKGSDLQVGHGGTYHVEQIELGLLPIYLASTAAIYGAFQRRVSSADLAAGALFFWFVLTVGSTLILPGISYLFLWPLMAGQIVLGQVLTAGQSVHALQRFLVLIPVTVGLILFGTTIYLVQRMFGASIYPVGGALSVLLLSLAFPYLEFRALPRAPVWAAGTLLAGIVLLVWVGFATPYNSDSPRQNFLFYSMNADTGKAYWVADGKLPHDDTLSPWLGSAPVKGIMKDVFPGSWEEQVWTNDAPVLNQPGPEMTVLEDNSEAGVRSLRLNLRSPRGAWAVMADVDAEGGILEGELYGEHDNREEPRDSLFFKVIDVPAEGVEIGLKLLPGIPVTIRLADVSLELPPLANRPGLYAVPLRTGFGGGHGVDGMTLLQRYYRLY
ncbi:MAG: M20/M25/M40 family metallo-hydrolase [Bacteroidota bacterium]